MFSSVQQYVYVTLLLATACATYRVASPLYEAIPLPPVRYGRCGRGEHASKETEQSLRDAYDTGNS